MLMDNMAYLQQIAGGNNNVPTQPKKKADNPFSKFLNIWTALIAGGLVIIITIVVLIVGMMNKVDTKDRDLMLKSYWQANYLLDETFDEYAEDVNSSDIRNMAASFKSVLNEIKLSEEQMLFDEYNIEADDTEEEEIAMNEASENNRLNSELENGRLSGRLDRVFLREMTMQIANMRSYQSEIAERTKSVSVRTFHQKTDKNLDTLYGQFHDYKSLAI